MVAGGMRCTLRSVPANIALVAWRNVAMLSSTQKERPCVAITTSWSLMTRSDTCTSGRFSANGSHCAPLVVDTKTPCSVPAKSKPARTGSSRITRRNAPVGIPSAMEVYVVP